MRLIQKLRHHKYRFDYVFARSLNHKLPIDVSLELSSQCNLACEYCYHSDPKNLPFKRGLMETSLAMKIINQAWLHSVPALKFNWKGESTLHPNFEVITRAAKERASGRTFQDRLTNSNFKFKNNHESIFIGLSHQTKVKVSFDSFIPAVMEKQRRLSNHAEIMANIDKFYNWPGRETELVIQSVRTKLNANEDLEGEIKKRWPSAGCSVRDMVKGRVNKNLDELENKTRDVERQPCIQAFARIIFNHKGLAFPCCPDVKEQLAIGNIETQTLYEIFNSTKAKGLRAGLKLGEQFQYEPCKSCSSFESYRGHKAGWNS